MHNSSVFRSPWAMSRLKKIPRPLSNTPGDALAIRLYGFLWCVQCLLGCQRLLNLFLQGG